MTNTDNNICSYVVGCLESNSKFTDASPTGKLRSFIRTVDGHLQLEKFLENEKELAPFLIALAGDCVPTNLKDLVIDSILNELEFTSYYTSIMKQFMNGTTCESFQEFVKKQDQKGLIQKQWFIENSTTVPTRKKKFGKGQLLPCEMNTMYLNLCLLGGTYADTKIVSELWGQGMTSCLKRKKELRGKFVCVALKYEHINNNSNAQLHSSRTPSQSMFPPKKKKNRPSLLKTPIKFSFQKIMSPSKKKNKYGNRKGTGAGSNYKIENRVDENIDDTGISPNKINVEFDSNSNRTETVPFSLEDVTTEIKNKLDDLLDNNDGCDFGIEQVLRSPNVSSPFPIRINNEVLVEEENGNHDILNGYCNDNGNCSFTLDDSGIDKEEQQNNNNNNKTSGLEINTMYDDELTMSNDILNGTWRLVTPDNIDDDSDSGIELKYGSPTSRFKSNPFRTHNEEENENSVSPRAKSSLLSRVLGERASVLPTYKEEKNNDNVQYSLDSEFSTTKNPSPPKKNNPLYRLLREIGRKSQINSTREVKMKEQ